MCESQECESAHDGAKLRAGVLCFRWSHSGSGSGVEFLLVSRRSRTESGFLSDASDVAPDKFTIPAGKFEADRDKSFEACAAREAVEEAGVECNLVQDLGWFDSRSKHDEPIRTRYFLGSCIRLLDSWQESGSRERCWFDPAVALEKIGYKSDLVAVVQEANKGLPKAAVSTLVPTHGGFKLGGRQIPVTKSVESNATGSNIGDSCSELSPNGAKRRCGVLCFREISQEGGNDGFEFLLVSRRSRRKDSGMDVANDRYTIPAGKFEPDNDASFEACAVRELEEEAGVECKVLHDMGWYDSRSKHDEPVRTRYFLGSCVRELEDWQEALSRERCWFPPADALHRVSYKRDLSAIMSQGIHLLHLQSASSVQGDSSGDEGTHEKEDILKVESPVPKQPDARRMSTKRHSTASVMCCPAGEEIRERYMCYSHQTGGHFRLVKPLPGTRIEVDLPANYVHKAADSTVVIARTGEQCKVFGSKVVLKPLNTCEERFYFKLIDGFLAPLLPFTCSFYGTKQLRHEHIEHLELEGEEVTVSSSSKPMKELDASENIRRYIVLEDLGSSAAKPCFLDLKIGCKQRAARHSAQKRSHMAAKAARTTSAELGFRICGMRCYDPETKSVQHYDKYWGQEVTVETMFRALGMFFGKGVGVQQRSIEGCWTDLVESVIKSLVELEAVLEHLEGNRFWGSSLLLLFDAAAAEECQGNSADLLKSVQLKIIDFANFEDVGGHGLDEEYLCGIRNFRAQLQAMICDHSASRCPQDRLSKPPSPQQQDREQEDLWQALQAANPVVVAAQTNGATNLTQTPQNGGYNKA